MGEFDLLARLRARLPKSGSRVHLGSGDDAAVCLPGGATVTSVDAAIEGVHFERRWSSLAQIGGKALAAALSDLAAMGAAPGEAYIVLGVPTYIDEDNCLELLDGMSAVAADTGVTLAGGDVTRAPVLTLAITVVGHAERAEDFITRSAAQPGDVLVVSGELGGAAAGLLLLEERADVPSREHPSKGISDDTSTALVRRQLEPRPRLAAGQALAAAGATAMIDLSDGLGGDANHLADASDVGLRIVADALPLAPGLVEIGTAKGRDPFDLAVAGGEDYELLATLPKRSLAGAEAAVADHGGLTLIGEVIEGGGVEIRLPGGGVLKAKGFDQLDR